MLSWRPTVDDSEIIKQAFISQEVDEPAANIMLASISDSTIKQYSNTYKLWSKYCAENNLDVFRAPVIKVIQFQQELFFKRNHLYIQQP
ncbi:unnamed protein product [Acanthoscelides obtectus]|uniref:Uncharacterized protein n=1 Tax=Acanthoscelides obtectus TaxID=200917 RepID=A0A9P0LU33_ACAOB|nr:unnamed protein product [Acanthoscelides obtectus]CAK1623178.1 hypothetical protein AOBTE_LOCUS1861 [Acanthoscelides obtectus]